MNHPFDSHDEEHFNDLMGEFPVNPPCEINSALLLLQTRHNRLNPERFTDVLVTRDDSIFNKLFFQLPQSLHLYLFQGILSNAGIYRKQIDQKGGVVYFGPNQQFRGYLPKDIESGIQRACSNLSMNDSEPLYNVTKFYQQFVLVHPFYDANGRIGRFITDIYLNFHGIYFSWKKLHGNSQWLKKINECHKRVGSNSAEPYIRFLVSHFKKCTLRKEDIDPETNI